MLMITDQSPKAKFTQMKAVIFERILVLCLCSHEDGGKGWFRESRFKYIGLGFFSIIKEVNKTGPSFWMPAAHISHHYSCKIG